MGIAAAPSRTLETWLAKGVPAAVHANGVGHDVQTHTTLVLEPPQKLVQEMETATI